MPAQPEKADSLIHLPSQIYTVRPIHSNVLGRFDSNPRHFGDDAIAHGLLGASILASEATRHSSQELRHLSIYFRKPAAMGSKTKPSIIATDTSLSELEIACIDPANEDKPFLMGTAKMGTRISYNSIAEDLKAIPSDPYRFLNPFAESETSNLCNFLQMYSKMILAGSVSVEGQTSYIDRRNPEIIPDIRIEPEILEGMRVIEGLLYLSGELGKKGGTIWGSQDVEFYYHPNSRINEFVIERRVRDIKLNTKKRSTKVTYDTNVWGVLNAGIIVKILGGRAVVFEPIE